MQKLAEHQNKRIQAPARKASKPTTDLPPRSLYFRVSYLKICQKLRAGFQRCPALPGSCCEPQRPRFQEGFEQHVFLKAITFYFERGSIKFFLMSHEKKISAHLLAIFPFGFHGNGHRAFHVSPSYPGLAALTAHPTQQSAFHQPSAQNDVPHRAEEEKHSVGDSFKPGPALLPVIMYFCTHLHMQTCSYLCCWHDIFLG